MGKPCSEAMVLLLPLWRLSMTERIRENFALRFLRPGASVLIVIISTLLPTNFRAKPVP